MALRTAILGYGRNGSTMHADALARNDAFQVVAVCDIDPARLLQASARFGCALYEDYRVMLAQQEALDLIVIVTRNDQHCAMTCDALQAGVNVLVTKPWALDAAEAQRMMTAAQAAGKQLLPWLPARWGSDFVRLREIVSAGTIGNVFFVRRAVSSFGTRCDWQTERQYGGGYLRNWGPHIVGSAMALLDCPVATAYGRMQQVINPGDVEDLFYALLTLENGAIVQAEYTIALDALPSWYIQGDRGTITVQGARITVRTNTPVQPHDPTQFATMQADATQISEEIVGNDVYGDEHRIYPEIAQALRGERPYPVTADHALELTRVLDAIRIASGEDRIVSLAGEHAPVAGGAAG